MTSQPDLVAQQPEKHGVELEPEPGPWGDITRRYRGARIEANDKGTLFGLFLPSHPMHGADFGNWEIAVRLIDAHLDGKPAPPPYRWRQA